MRYTNFTDIPLILAVWLAAEDGYDLVYDSNTVSATDLLKPLRSVILSRRILSQQKSIDVDDLVPSRVGHAVHQAVEDAWIYRRDGAMERLGIPKEVRDRVYFNPDPGETLPDNAIVIYMEQRTTREIDGWKVSGKFDVVNQGTVEDTKTTKTYNWIKGSNDEKYGMQGSIYRWLNPKIIINDYIRVLMIFTDWSPLKAKADKTYPQKRIMERILPLTSIEETESWIRVKLSQLTHFLSKPQEELPQCTPEELWMDPPQWAYYKDKTKTSRATKLFDTSAEAHAFAASQGTQSGSLIVKREMEPKFCRFCPANTVCTQAEGYINAGILQL